MKLSILLGAGSSLPAGFPSTESITERMLSGQGVRRHTDETYSIDSNQPPDSQTTRTIHIVRRLYAEAERYHAENSMMRPNYETLFHLFEQVLAEECGNRENPAVRAFMTELRTDLAKLVPSRDYIDSLRKSINYIADIVWRCLSANPDSTDHLKIFGDACELGRVDSISTLCHDTHVETYLRERGICLADGFSDAECGVRYWQNEFPKNKIPFFKLHGSVDWFRLCPDSSHAWYDDRIGIPLDSDYEHTKDKDGNFQTALDNRPILLIGTHNKFQEYTGRIFRDLHYKFRLSIQNSERLVVCGYSFGDKGINTEIIEWYYARRGRQICIIHPDPANLVDNARGAVRNKWENWTKAGAIRLIPKKLEDVETKEFWESVAI